jgi:Caspase domain
VPTLTVFMVGTFAVVLRKKNENDKKYNAVRILLPKTPQLTSQFDSSIVIPASVPFIGIYSDLLGPNPPKPLLRTFYSFPRMEGMADEQDVTFYKLEVRKPLIITPLGKLSPFSAKFGKVNFEQGPTKTNSRYLNWSPEMIEYSPGNHVVHLDYLGKNVKEDAAYVEFNFGELSVARIRPDHKYRYIHGNDDFHRHIADTLQLRVEHDKPGVTIAISEDMQFTTDDENVQVLIGSEPLVDIADYEATHPCGQPYYHHELLYRFSKTPPVHAQHVVTPVCTNIKRGSKDPGAGGCIPHTKMVADYSGTTPEEVTPPKKGAVATKQHAVSLHVGVNQLAQNFPSPEPIDPLKTCANDARSMSKLAADAKFKVPDGLDTNVLIDDDATHANVERAIRRCGEVLADNGYFLLTVSCHGLPGDPDTAGWCLYSKVMTYTQVRNLFTAYFPKSARILVICDCCHAVDFDAGAAHVKQVSFAVRAQVAKFQFHRADLKFALTPSEDGEPTVYFVFACANDEVIEDGADPTGLSPFTKCVIDWAGAATFDDFEQQLQSCTGKGSHIRRNPRVEKWESIGPFRAPEE